MCWRMLTLTILSATVAVPLACGKGKKPIDNAAVVAMVKQGDAFAAQHNFAKALSCYNKADKMAEHACSACQLRKVTVEKQVGNFEAALDDAKKAIKEAGNDKGAVAEAYLVRAVVLGETVSDAKDKHLAEAIAEVQQALALEPALPLAHFDLGFLLLKQGHDSEGVAQLNTFLASGSGDASAANLARQFIANPRRARERLAPGFNVTTLEGAQLSLASLHGKAVLLDFWGTWCPPCRDSVPDLLKLHQKFDGQPVEFVGISSDTDEEKWRGFVAKHHMNWPEYIDLSGNVLSSFAVHEFPTYVVVDGDGVIRFRQSGYDNMTFVQLEGAIQKALKENSENAASASTARPN